MATDGRVVIGRIGRPHGVLGEVRVIPTGPTLQTLQPGERVYVVSDELPRELEVEAVRAVDRGVLLRFAGIATREDVATLTGASVAVVAERLSELGADDEFYVRDLVGCLVVSGDTRLGTVAEVYSGAANDALVVRDADGEDLLIPFTHDAITSVDLVARRVEVRSGLLERGGAA